MLSVEFYMYSTLQSLSLVSPYSIPGLKLLLPFGTQSLLQLPALPADLSPHSLATSAVSLLTSPSLLVFLYGYYLRPQLEERIYRLIRRRLPKPSLPDELSVRVAYEENLIEWVVPSLGRRSDEELHRSKLTLLQDIVCEMKVFRRWVSSLFGLVSSKSSDQQDQQFFRDEKMESLRNSFEMLRHELDEAQPNGTHAGGPSDALPAAAAPPTQQPTGSTAQDQQDPDAILNQVLTNENRMSQSPGEISNDFFSETATAGRATGFSTTSNSHNPTSASQNDENFVRHRQNSRSNTLLSRPSSPETSPPTSPRVRASLIHQNSDLVTMQLELLGNRNRNSQNEAQDNAQIAGNAATSDAPSQSQPALAPMDDETIAQVFQTMRIAAAQDLLRQRAARREIMRLALGQALNSPQTADTEEAVNTTRAINTAPTELAVPEERSQDTTQGTRANASPHFESFEQALEAIVPNILPDGVEEPNDEEPPTDSNPVAVTENDDTQSEIPAEPLLPSALASGQSTSTSSDAHRVTLLSAYPVDSLASHLAAAISGIILAPIESLYLRSLTHSWLTTHPSSTTLISGVHPLGLWFGGRTWSDIGAYTCRLVLMRGMQVAMRAGIWGFLVGSTMRIGRNFCGWGKL